MTKIVNKINNIKEGTAMIVSVVDEDKSINILLAKENNIIKAYDIDMMVE